MYIYIYISQPLGLFHHQLLIHQIFLKKMCCHNHAGKAIIHCMPEQKNAFTVVSLLSLLCQRVLEEHLFVCDLPFHAQALLKVPRSHTACETD